MTRRNKNKTFQIKKVQGPQRNSINNQTIDPDIGLIELKSDLLQKYLGSGLVGLQASLEVLTTSSADELLCKHGYQLYRKMLMDAEVDAGIDVLIQSSSAKPLKAIPASGILESDYGLAKEYADFTNYVFSRFDIDTWRREQTRNALVFGNSVSEIDWEYLDKGRYKNKFVISDLRLQKPENYGFIVDRWGEIYGVAPLGLASGTVFPLGNLIPLDVNGLATNLNGAVPRYKLAIWTWEKKENDPRGTSALIPAYIPWWSKQRAIEEWNQWLGRYAQPSLWATPGPDAIPECITHPNGSQSFIPPTQSLLTALMNFKSASVLALPYGSTLNVIAPPGGATPFIESIKLFNIEISRALLGQHLATGEGDNQSRAAAEVHGTVLRQLINSLRRFQARQIKEELVRPLIEANFKISDYELIPDIYLGDGDGWQPTMTEIGVLLQSGFFTQDQLPKLDRILGFPVRETTLIAGPHSVQSSVLDQPKEDTREPISIDRKGL